MGFDRRTLILPAGTVFEEHTIVTPGDVVVSDRAEVEFGLHSEKRVYVGENVHIGGHVASDGEARFDLFTEVEGDVQCAEYCFLGEGASVGGQLSVDGDLDVGDDVEIAEGFEAKGWINIRGPIPMIVYIYIYLMEMLRAGRSEEVARIIDELSRKQDEIHVDEGFCYVPDGTRLGLQDSHVTGHLSAGPDCRIVGNLEVDGNVRLGEGTEVYGAIRADGEVKVEPHASVDGDVDADDRVELAEDAHVAGSLSAPEVRLHHTALVEGTVQAADGINFVTRSTEAMEDKVERFEADAPEGVEELLE